MLELQVFLGRAQVLQFLHICLPRNDGTPQAIRGRGAFMRTGLRSWVAFFCIDMAPYRAELLLQLPLCWATLG